MALVKLGGLAQDVRGTLNGSVFSRNRGGAYIRTKVSPVQPVSAFSANSRQAFKAASTSWATGLTDAERAGWIAFAATHPFINVFGDPVIVSGIAMFQGLNKRLQQLGFDMIADAPIAIDVVAPGAIAAQMMIDATPTCTLDFGAVTVPPTSNIIVYVWATMPIPLGRTPVQSDYRLLNDFNATLNNINTNWGPLYLTRFAPFVPTAGQKVCLRMAYLDTNDGAISVVSEVTVIVSEIPGPFIDLAFSSLISNVETITTQTPHGLVMGMNVEVSGSTNSVRINNSGAVTAILSETQFTMDNGLADVTLAADGGVMQRIA